MCCWVCCGWQMWEKASLVGELKNWCLVFFPSELISSLTTFCKNRIILLALKKLNLLWNTVLNQNFYIKMLDFFNNKLSLVLKKEFLRCNITPWCCNCIQKLKWYVGFIFESVLKRSWNQDGRPTPASLSRCSTVTYLYAAFKCLQPCPKLHRCQAGDI